VPAPARWRAPPHAAELPQHLALHAIDSVPRKSDRASRSLLHQASPQRNARRPATYISTDMLEARAAYILKLSESAALNHVAADRALYKDYLAHAAVLLASTVRGAPLWPTPSSQARPPWGPSPCGSGRGRSRTSGISWSRPSRRERLLRSSGNPPYPAGEKERSQGVKCNAASGLNVTLEAGDLGRHNRQSILHLEAIQATGNHAGGAISHRFSRLTRCWAVAVPGYFCIRRLPPLRAA
jgi:hypothetical protein